MIYLFVILFCLNASAVWSIGLLLAQRRQRTIHHEISVHVVEDGVQFWAPDDSAAASIMLTMTKD